MSATSSAPAPAPASGGSGWPAYALVAVALGAAVYAFSPRPAPPFPATQIFPDRLLITGLAQSGSRIVAVGELGRILVADAPQGPWHEAKVEPARGSTLTNVSFVDERTAIAVGHDGWILRSQDRGESWKEAAFDAEHPDPLLGIAGPFEGKLFAFGAFGLLLTSGDQGLTWTRETLNIADDAAKSAAPADENADPFANLSAGGGLAQRHLNAMVRATDGSLLLLGEQGLMLQSSDNGQSWKSLPQVYGGSYFGALNLPDGGLLVFGMRGNAYVSRDLARTWSRCDVPMAVSLFGGTVTPQGTIVLVGDSNTVLTSGDGGAHFTLAAQAEHRGLAAGLAAVLALPGGGLLTGGDGGISLQKTGAAGGRS